MTNVLDLSHVRSYQSEARLDSALARLGLDKYEEDGIPVEYFKCVTPEGRFTAVFMYSRVLKRVGGYAGHFSDHGFMSV